MTSIEQLLNEEKKRIEVQEKLTPLQHEMTQLVEKIRRINDSMPFYEKSFIQEKLWKNISPDLQETILMERNERDASLSSDNTSYCAKDYYFDPFRDKFDFVTSTIDNDGKIIITVSCVRKEGSISGLLRFLDTYNTVPFTIEELDSYIKNQYLIVK